MRQKEELKYDVYCNSRYLYQCYSNNLFWGCLDSELVTVTDSAVLGGVVEAVSSISAVGHKIFFSIFRHSRFIIYQLTFNDSELSLKL